MWKRPPLGAYITVEDVGAISPTIHSHAAQALCIGSSSQTPEFASPCRGAQASAQEEEEVVGYRLEELLGRGAFGDVHKARRLIDELECAIKRVCLRSLDPNLRAKALQEADLLRGLSSPFILQYVDSFTKDLELCIVTEYCGGGTLADLLCKRREARDETAGISLGPSCGSLVAVGMPTRKSIRLGLLGEANSTTVSPPTSAFVAGAIVSRFGLSEDVVCTLGAQVALGLVHLHVRRIVHRDVKPANIFLRGDGGALLGDLGVSKVLADANEQASTFIGSPSYMAPEVIGGLPYGAASDMWSLGCVMFEMCALQKPFEAPTAMALYTKILNHKQPPALPNSVVSNREGNYSAEVRHIIGRCLRRSPQDRPGAAQLLRLKPLRQVVERLGHSEDLPPPQPTASPSSTNSATTMGVSQRSQIPWGGGPGRDTRASQANATRLPKPSLTQQSFLPLPRQHLSGWSKASFAPIASTRNSNGTSCHAVQRASSLTSKVSALSASSAGDRGGRRRSSDGYGAKPQLPITKVNVATNGGSAISTLVERHASAQPQQPQQLMAVRPDSLAFSVPTDAVTSPKRCKFPETCLGFGDTTICGASEGVLSPGRGSRATETLWCRSLGTGSNDAEWVADATSASVGVLFSSVNATIENANTNPDHIIESFHDSEGTEDEAVFCDKDDPMWLECPAFHDIESCNREDGKQHKLGEDLQDEEAEGGVCFGVTSIGTLSTPQSFLNSETSCFGMSLSTVCSMVSGQSQTPVAASSACAPTCPTQPVRTFEPQNFSPASHLPTSSTSAWALASLAQKPRALVSPLGSIVSTGVSAARSTTPSLLVPSTMVSSFAREFGGKPSGTNPAFFGLAPKVVASAVSSLETKWQDFSAATLATPDDLGRGDEGFHDDDDDATGQTEDTVDNPGSQLPLRGIFPLAARKPGAVEKISDRGCSSTSRLARGSGVAALARCLAASPPSSSTSVASRYVGCGVTPRTPAGTPRRRSTTPTPQ